MYEIMALGDVWLHHLCPHRMKDQRDSTIKGTDREDFIEFALRTFISTARRDERYVFWLVLHGAVSIPSLQYIYQINE